MSTETGRQAASGIANVTLTNALVLRDRVLADLTEQNQRASTLTMQLTEAEAHEERALSQYEDAPQPTAETLRAALDEVHARIRRALKAKREAEQRVADERKQATAAYLASQGKQIAALKAKFREGVKGLDVAFNELAAWQAGFDALGLNQPDPLVLDGIAFMAPRVSIAELHDTVRTALKR